MCLAFYNSILKSQGMERNYIVVCMYMQLCTCTIATLRTLPLSPIAKEDNAITAGPAMNFSPMATIVIRVPQAIILGRDAMKRPNE